MSIDPVGLLGPGGVGGVRAPGGGAAPVEGKGGFGELLLRNLGETNKLQSDATRATEELLAGRRDDVETVLMQTQKADTAFRMMLAVRNKLMEAFEEIKQFRV
ncbi:MAG: flagellar hook-basal body complex protein FliE [Phycisphaerales bacterium]